MPVNRRKKDVKQRGSHTHGWGSKKKHRGSGNRGGKGMAGTGKRADQRKPSIWKTDYFGKHGFVHRRIVHNTVNVEYLDQNVEKLAVLNLAKREGNGYIVNIADLGFDKLLGKGKVAKRMVITASSASPRAVESIKAAGGEVVVPANKKEA
ncbi:uL15 family ribosomal protein [Candidatus Woesearchaeota archaeon]|nr:uL15 family ribosomal protein [Candidatus Woesearchaeota archaeon]